MGAGGGIYRRALSSEDIPDEYSYPLLGVAEGLDIEIAFYDFMVEVVVIEV
jgi:hypothetical protein